MEYNPELLTALLELLRDSGVEEFEGFGFHVRFSTTAVPAVKEMDVEPQYVETPGGRQSMWEEPELWPGGKPPRFPTR